MESICLDSSSSDTDQDWDFVEQGFGGPRTPSTISEEAQPEHLERDSPPQRYDDTSDAESNGDHRGPPVRKRTGFDSRIEQILYQNPDLPILIVDAGKSSESGGKYIVYTIRTGVRHEDLCAGSYTDIL